MHTRVDLARYSTGLAELRNMIVLPQGGITRRPGFSMGNPAGFDSWYSTEAKLIPFVFNASDSVILEFGNYTARVWVKSDNFTRAIASFRTPYAISDVGALRYVQSGNVIFFAHRNYPPQMLTRTSLASWTFSDLEFHDGPFIDGTEWARDVELIFTQGANFLDGGLAFTVQTKNNVSLFDSSLAGTLIKLEYAQDGQSSSFNVTGSTENKYSKVFEVKGTLNVTTAGEDWHGTISIERSIDGGESWITVKQYVRRSTDTQGQWDFSISETEDYVLYRVGAKLHPDYKETTIYLAVTVSGFLKKEIYKIESVTNSQKARLTPQDKLALRMKTGRLINSETIPVRLWSMGAFGKKQGYPGAIAMYQDRLIFASTPLQPQTIWMSKTGDYSNFGVSDPLSDDDAINITLAGSSADGIHSLAATQDLFAFTESGEWRVRGAGDSGAISPTALTAHQQTNIGSKAIQPIIANGQIIFVQTQGQKVYTLGYDLNIDGYTGHEISIMSAHLFDGKQITCMAYQQIPDSLLWFVLNDGNAAVCTYNPEHDIFGWSLQDAAGYALKSIAVIPGQRQTELFAVPSSNYTPVAYLLSLNERQNEKNFQDVDNVYESSMRTLRLNIQDEGGSTFASKKLIPRLIIHALNTNTAWAAPGDYSGEATNWERRRRVQWQNNGYLSDADIQLDNGFTHDACIQIRSAEGQALTITGISPVITQGG